MAQYISYSQPAMMMLAADHDVLMHCLDSQRVEANEAFGNTSHTIPGSSCTGRPQAAQQAFQTNIDRESMILTKHRAKAQSPA